MQSSARPRTVFTARITDRSQAGRLVKVDIRIAARLTASLMKTYMSFGSLHGLFHAEVRQWVPVAANARSADRCAYPCLHHTPQTNAN
eukprot:3993182-Pleurochrysis_carterae.AAC.1